MSESQWLEARGTFEPPGSTYGIVTNKLIGAAVIDVENPGFHIRSLGFGSGQHAGWNQVLCGVVLCSVTFVFAIASMLQALRERKRMRRERRELEERDRIAENTARPLGVDEVLIQVPMMRLNSLTEDQHKHIARGSTNPTQAATASSRPLAPPRSVDTQATWSVPIAATNPQ